MSKDLKEGDTMEEDPVSVKMSAEEWDAEYNRVAAKLERFAYRLKTDPEFAREWQQVLEQTRPEREQWLNSEISNSQSEPKPS